MYSPAPSCFSNLTSKARPACNFPQRCCPRLRKARHPQPSRRAAGWPHHTQSSGREFYGLSIGALALLVLRRIRNLTSTRLGGTNTTPASMNRSVKASLSESVSCPTQTATKMDGDDRTRRRIDTKMDGRSCNCGEGDSGQRRTNACVECPCV
jgi:hypothetical protein